MATVLQRFLGPARALEPRQYTLETDSGKPAVCCPGCEEVHDLENAVMPGGLVRYEWKCPTRGCQFKAFLQLESFDEDVLR